MIISGIGTYQQVQQTLQRTLAGQSAGGGSGASFANMLGEAFNDLKELQSQADVAATQVATGQPVELHEAMIAMEKASVGFQLGLQVRNKLVEAYQEITRMQV